MNDYLVCGECNFGGLTSQFKKTKGICPKCKKYNVVEDRDATAEEISKVKQFN